MDASLNAEKTDSTHSDYKKAASESENSQGQDSAIRAKKIKVNSKQSECSEDSGKYEDLKKHYGLREVSVTLVQLSSRVLKLLRVKAEVEFVLKLKRQRHCRRQLILGTPKEKTERGEYTCNTEGCSRHGTIYRSKTHLKRHVYFCHSERKRRKHPCKLCPKVYSEKSNLESHVNTAHRGVRPYVCSHCGSDFPGYKSLQKHLVHVHNDYRRKPTHFFCRICSSKFDSPHLLNKHKPDCVGKGKELGFMCDVCGYKCRVKSRLNEHMESHSDSRPAICNVCGSAFKRKSYLKIHMRLHSDDPNIRENASPQSRTNPAKTTKPYKRKPPELKLVCEICDYKCAYKSQLQLHMFSHTSVRSAICPVCGKGFRRQSDLNSHLLLHSDERTLLCADCGQSFKSKTSLWAHSKLHRPRTSYSCQFCDKQFLTKNYVRVHLQQAHDFTEENSKAQSCT